MEEYSILIADDDTSHLRILAGNILESHPSCRLLIANNGRAAVDVAFKNYPDLILMDWEMPVMDGLQATRMIKQGGAGENTWLTYIVMVTGVHNDNEKLKEAIEAGADDFLKKPYDKIELIARINSHLRRIDLVKQVISQEKEISEREKQLLKEEVIRNQKELALNSVSILRLGQLIDSVSNDISSLKPFANEEGKKRIKEITEKLNFRSSEHMWNEFEMSFKKVHSNFYTSLIEKIPDVTIREKRLCAFLKMNMSTKEIASVTFQTPNSIDVAKHRIRKKAGLENDEDLHNFLQNL